MRCPRGAYNAATGVNLGGPGGLRGLHGLNCKGNGTASSTGIDINTSNTTLENITVGGFTNGIVIGDLSNAGPPTNTKQWPVQGVVLENIQAGSGTMTNLIQLSNAGTCFDSNCEGTTTSDIELLGITNFLGNCTNTINDQLTGYTVTKSQAGSVAMYVVGQPTYYLNVAPKSAAQMTRFMTIPTETSTGTGSTPWGFGTTNVTGKTCTIVGSFYSNTAGSSGNNFFACIPQSGGTKKWEPIL